VTSDDSTEAEAETVVYRQSAFRHARLSGSGLDGYNEDEFV